jgi:peptidoglycan-N-acetylglucosamine deacetylase
VVEIDTTGWPAFGTEHFKQYDFLRETAPGLKTRQWCLRRCRKNCVKATFFEIGQHATWRPDLTRALVSARMTVGSHTWSHKDLAKNPYAKDLAQAEQEIEMGVSAIRMAAGGGSIAPFFRFPDLQQPPELIAYLGTRNIGIFSADIDTFDFKLRNPEDVVRSTMTKLAKHGKSELIRQLKAGSYKIVHMVPKEPVTTVAKYDDMVRAQNKYSTSNNTRPESNVVKTLAQ